MKIAIVDYGLGNIMSISSSLKFLGVKDIILSSDYSMLAEADKLILPGVGSFGNAMRLIKSRKLDLYINELVIESGKPILGICLGMQLLGKSSDEDGNNDGLGLVDGVVRKFTATDIKIPHVGFNQVRTVVNSRLFYDIKTDPDFYFTHSYRMISNSDINASTCNYGGEFVASFEKNNIAGVQFHPELSQHNGLSLLKNFIDKF